MDCHTGKSARQPHQEAQVASSTLRPRCSARLCIVPARSGSAKSGASSDCSEAARPDAPLETLAALEEEEREPFDFIFIDADKQNNSSYLDWAVRLGRPGAAVVLDNTIWEGAVLDPDIDPVNAPGIIDALKLLGNHPRLDATVIQTVGSKGWDGFALARMLPQNSK